MGYCYGIAVGAPGARVGYGVQGFSAAGAGDFDAGTDRAHADGDDGAHGGSAEPDAASQPHNDAQPRRHGHSVEHAAARAAVAANHRADGRAHRGRHG